MATLTMYRGCIEERHIDWLKVIGQAKSAGQLNVLETLHKKEDKPQLNIQLAGCGTSVNLKIAPNYLIQFFFTYKWTVFVEY